jgi:hypothetical protein
MKRMADSYLVRAHVFGTYRYLSHRYIFDAWVAKDAATKFSKSQAEIWRRLLSRRYPHRKVRVVHA